MEDNRECKNLRLFITGSTGQQQCMNSLLHFLNDEDVNELNAR